MKANELMIGDWVLDTRTDTPLRVNPFMAEMEVPEWESIPLTPEILEKNGFEAIKEGRYPSLRNYYNDIIFQLEGIKEEGNCKILYIFKNIPILYVHQLQHALKLCGIDKEIVV
jgi:hypothetical protein